jgi:hypothetical protein
VNVTGSDGFHALSRTITFEISERRSSSFSGDPANVVVGHVTEFSILTELRSDASELTVRVTPAADAVAPLLARAVGPSLAGFGLTGWLADPRLESISNSGEVRMNDNWNGDPALAAAMAAAGAFPFSDPGSADAALITPGLSDAPSWRVSAATPGFGSVLFEVMPATPLDGVKSPRLANGSFRHRLDSVHATVLGFVVQGGTAVTLTLRVSAASAGIPAASISAFDSAGAPIAAQHVAADDHGTTMLVLSLAPGADTVVLRAATSGEDIFVGWSVE